MRYPFIFFICVAAMVQVAPLQAASKSKDPAPAAAPQSSAERYENLALFQKVLFFIEQNYVEDVKTKDLVHGAIKGMLETLDPHSNFLPPEVFKDMKIDTSGKFGGIGIEIGVKDSALTVISPIEDTPAHKVGIRAGDKILKINGDSTKGLSLSEAVSKMRGKRGSDVTIEILREGMEKPQEFTLTRAEIKIQTTKSETLEPGFLYARLTNFNERSTGDVKRAIENFEKKEGPIKGMILDLRNNPGGLLDQAVDITSLFVDKGVVVSTRGRTEDGQNVREAKTGMAHKGFPLVVLVNGASASASEIVAGALQDHKRAIIMGQPTFGKGSVQQVVELAPDIGLKLTIARYYTPSGRSIQLKGIQPDIVLDDLDQKVIDEAKRKMAIMREKDLKHAMEQEDADEIMAQAEKQPAKEEKPKEEIRLFVAKEDYQVKQALNYLKSFQMFANSNLGTVPVAQPQLKTTTMKAEAK